jgi:hypothetical protein
VSVFLAIVNLISTSGIDFGPINLHGLGLLASVAPGWFIRRIFQRLRQLPGANARTRR